MKNFFLQKLLSASIYLPLKATHNKTFGFCKNLEIADLFRVSLWKTKK